MSPDTDREYVLVGDHPESLSGGRTIAPGERVAESDLDLAPEVGVGDGWLIDDGKLVDVESFDAGDALSREALKARAAELDVQGRSKMNAEELREAIAAREAELAAGGGQNGEGEQPDADGGDS